MVMRISEMHWQQVESYIGSNNICVLPLGCTEQHAYLSLSTDTILAEKLAFDSAQTLGIPVFPVVPYGLTPSFLEFPGTVSLSSDLYLKLIGEILCSLLKQGFRRIFILNGHGGNTPARAVISEALTKFPDARIKWHDW